MRKIFFLLLCMLLPAMIFAQGDISSIQINYPEISETETQQITVYFTPLNVNADSVALPPGGSLEALINLGGNEFPAMISIPQTPLDLVLVLDTSGSMGGVGSQMVSAAVNAIQQAPADTRFTVITFSDDTNIQQLVTDSNNQQQVISAVQGITNFAGGTCLYDATMRGLQQLQTRGRPGRRAIIVFTDGRDERVAGGELDPCSQSNQNTVVDTATNSAFRVPVHTIGMRGDQPIAEGSLETIAGATGGRYVVGDSSQLTTLFGQIIADLQNQRSATATVCLQAGSYTGFMQFGGGYGSPISAPLPEITLQLTCAPPTPTLTPAPTQLIVRPPRPEGNYLVFDISVGGSILPVQYRATVINGETRTQLPSPYGEMMVNPANPQIRLPLTEIAAQSLVVEVQALDASGAVIAEFTTDDIQPERTPTPTPEPTPAPLAMGITIPGIRYEEDQQRFRIEVNAPPSDLIIGYTIRIINRETGELVDSITRLEPPQNPVFLSETGALEQPLEPGAYNFVLELAIQGALPGDQLPTAAYEITKLPPVLPPWYVRLSRWFAGNIVALLGLVLVAVAAITGVVFFLRKRDGGKQKHEMPEFTSEHEDSAALGYTKFTDDIVSPSVANIMGRLTVISSTTLDVGRRWDINPKATPLYIGNPNSPKAQGRSLYIPIKDNGVTGVHVSFHFANGTFTIVDEASRNGTLLDNDMMEPNRRYPLRRFHTSQINVGMNHVFGFRYLINGMELENDPTKPEEMQQPPPFVANPQTAPYEQPPSGGEMITGKMQVPIIAEKVETGKLERNHIPADVIAALHIIDAPDIETFNRTTFTLKDKLFWIGRDEILSLTIPEKHISSTHACIFWEDNTFYLADYSTNGTWLNNTRLESEVPYLLQPDQQHEIQLATNCALLRFTYTRSTHKVKPVKDGKFDEAGTGFTNGKTNEAKLSDRFLQQKPATEPPTQETETTPPEAYEIPNLRLPDSVSSELVVVTESGLEVNRTVFIASGKITIGRSDSQDCKVHSAHVSRHHATLFWDQERFHLLDNGSQNGVYLDGERIESSQPVTLNPDRRYTIHLGPHTDEPTCLRFAYTDTRTQFFNLDDSSM